MLKKTERLDKRQFSQYFNNGRRNHGSYTTVIVHPHPRFACVVVVGKKVAKKAHDRNRLKRQAYSVVEKIKTERELKGVFIIILKPAIAKLTKNKLREELDKEVGKVLQ